MIIVVPSGWIWQILIPYWFHYANYLDLLSLLFAHGFFYRVMGKLLWKPWFWDVFFFIYGWGMGLDGFFLREHELKRWNFWVNNNILPNLPMSSLLNYVDNHAVLMIVIVYEDPSCDSKRIGWNHQPESRVESKHWDPGVWLFRTWVEWNKHVCVL
jgi:hypothetical protein